MLPPFLGGFRTSWLKGRNSWCQSWTIDELEFLLHAFFLFLGNTKTPNWYFNDLNDISGEGSKLHPFHELPL